MRGQFMSKVLIVLPDFDVDPTEVAVPFHVLTAAGHQVSFATQSGGLATCDLMTLTGRGLPRHLQVLKCRSENVEIYRAMTDSSSFKRPMAWHEVETTDFDALLLPGGHGPGMRAYIDSAAVHAICAAFFARKAPVAAICHGVMALGRARDTSGRSVLHGYTTTGLTNTQERLAIALTKPFLGDHYQTFPITVQDDVIKGLAAHSDFKDGPLLTTYGTKARPDAGFTNMHDHYLSARWPGDAWRFALQFRALLAQCPRTSLELMDITDASQP
jgi:protease I